jgi:hypothetical protein
MNKAEIGYKHHVKRNMVERLQPMLIQKRNFGRSISIITNADGSPRAIVREKGIAPII